MCSFSFEWIYFHLFFSYVNLFLYQPLLFTGFDSFFFALLASQTFFFLRQQAENWVKKKQKLFISSPHSMWVKSDAFGLSYNFNLIFFLLLVLWCKIKRFVYVFWLSLLCIKKKKQPFLLFDYKQQPQLRRCCV